VEFCGEGPVFGRHMAVLPGKQESKQLDGHHVLSPPNLWRDLVVPPATP
jgi:hypothetical protein